MLWIIFFARQLLLKIFCKRIFCETIFLISILCYNCHLRKVIVLRSVGKMAKKSNRFKMNFLQKQFLTKSRVLKGF